MIQGLKLREGTQGGILQASMHFEVDQTEEQEREGREDFSIFI